MPLQRRFPDFSYITQNGRLTDFLDCVIIRWGSFLPCQSSNGKQEIFVYCPLQPKSFYDFMILCDLLTTTQVGSCGLASKTHPACGLLIIAHLITTATLFQTPSTHPSISHVWGEPRADLEWHPTEKTHPASGYEKMDSTKQYVLLSCETACHRKLWIQRDLELAG